VHERVLDIEIVLVVEYSDLLLCSLWLLVPVIASWRNWNGGEIHWLIRVVGCRHDCGYVLEVKKRERRLCSNLGKKKPPKLNANAQMQSRLSLKEGREFVYRRGYRDATIAPGN
jgi:hypothetical protein